MAVDREDRRLKATGLALVLLACGWLVALGRQAQLLWPPGADELAALAWRVQVAANGLGLALLLLALGCGSARPWRTPRRRRAFAGWWCMLNLAAPLLLWGFFDADNRLSQSLEALGWDTAAGAAGAGLALLLWRIWVRTRRLSAPDAADVMREDARAPVLYLRSFADDGTAVVDDGGSRTFAAILGLVGLPSPEQEMAQLLQAAGPVVAIGQPGEPLPRLGAARLYVSHGQWQAEVLALMARARLVVIRVGASPGVRWEIEQALARLPRERLVLAFFGRGALQVHPAVQQQLAPVLGAQWAASLPEPPPSGWRFWGWRDPRRRIGSLVCFPHGAAPLVVPLSHWPLWGRDLGLFFLARISAPPLRRAWRVVFDRLGVAAGTFAAPRSRAAAVLLAVFVGGFGAHWFYLGRRRRGWVFLGLFVAGSYLVAWWDALRFVWMDRASFDALAAAAPLSSARPA